MAQIQKKFIAANAVDGSKIRLNNDENLKARNAADSSDVNIVKLNASDRIEFASVPQSPSDALVANDLVRFSQLQSVSGDVDALIALSGVPAGAVDLGTFTGGIIPDASTIKDALQSLETSIEALPDPIVYKGTYNAATNTPTLSDTDVGVTGYLYQVTVAGSQDFGAGSISFDVGDKVVNNGSQWQKWDMTDAVSSVNGQTGAVSLALDDLSDVNAAAPADLDVLTYDSGTGEWINAPLPAAVAYTGGDMITLTGSAFSVDLASLSGLESSNPGNAAGQLRVKLEASNPSLQINASGELGAKLDASGAILKGAAGLSISVDNSSIEIATNALQIKNSGVTLAKLASDSVDENKIVSTSISTTGALNGGSGTKLSARVDAATVKINASNNLEALKQIEENLTLSGGDITAQFIDLAHAAYGASASVNSVKLSVVGGPQQLKTVDYTVSLTGGAGGVTRITFAGDLASGGNAALVAADIVSVSYDYLT